MRPWRSQLPQVLRRGGSVAAASLCLPRRTWDRAVRAEHAAVTRLGPKHGATAGTVVEPLAGVGRHRLGGRTATERAGDRRLGHHHRRSLLAPTRSEEHTSELQSLMRISYAVFCLKTKNTTS